MDGNSLRNLQEAYLQVHQEVEQFDEAAKRTPKKVRGAKDPEKEMAGRSDAGKRISGDENTGPNYYTKGRSRGAEVDAPTQPGQKPKGTPKLASWEKDDIQYRKANLKSGKVHKVGGERGLPESTDLFDIILEYLVAEGYADTNRAAIAIMSNMSEEWRESIFEEVLDEAEGSYGKTPKATAAYGALANKRRAKPASEYSERGEKKSKVTRAERHATRSQRTAADHSGKKSTKPAWHSYQRSNMTQSDRDYLRGQSEYGHVGYDGEGGGGSKPKGKKLERQRKTGVSAD